MNWWEKTECEFEEEREELIERINEDAANYLFAMQFDDPYFWKCFMKKKIHCKLYLYGKIKKNFDLIGGLDVLLWS